MKRETHLTAFALIIPVVTFAMCAAMLAIFYRGCL